MPNGSIKSVDLFEKVSTKLSHNNHSSSPDLKITDQRQMKVVIQKLNTPMGNSGTGQWSLQKMPAHEVKKLRFAQKNGSLSQMSVDGGGQRSNELLQPGTVKYRQLMVDGQGIEFESLTLPRYHQLVDKGVSTDPEVGMKKKKDQDERA